MDLNVLALLLVTKYNPVTIIRTGRKSVRFYTSPCRNVSLAVKMEVVERKIEMFG